jgi:DNA-binding Lrp family transcriptional regulator
MKCEPQNKIAEVVGLSQPTVSEIIAKNIGNGKKTDSDIFRDFSQENSALRIYDIWNFSKATNEVKHFGNIPPEIIEFG